MKNIFIIILLFFSNIIYCQWEFNINYNIGLNYFINHSTYSKFPSLRLFGTINLYCKRNDTYVFQYSPTISIYKNTIGTNLTPLKSEISYDFMNTFSFGVELFDTTFTKLARSMHNGDYYNLSVNKEGALMFFSNILLNKKKKRNQINGGFLITLKNVSILYYNDGPPFDFMGISDGFDRYWTGGGGIFIHKENYNIIELTYDQFTGYVPLLYELSTLLGIDVPYSIGNIENYNTSAYNLKIGIDRFLSVDVGVIGSLIDKKGRFWGIQDKIHILGNYALHSNSDNTKIYFGTRLNYLAK